MKALVWKCGGGMRKENNFRKIVLFRNDRARLWLSKSWWRIWKRRTKERRTQSASAGSPGRIYVVVTVRRCLGIPVLIVRQWSPAACPLGVVILKLQSSCRLSPHTTKEADQNKIAHIKLHQANRFSTYFTRKLIHFSQDLVFTCCWTNSMDYSEIYFATKFSSKLIWGRPSLALRGCASCWELCRQEEGVTYCYLGHISLDAMEGRKWTYKSRRIASLC